MLKNLFSCLVISLLFIGYTFSYEVVLKNGKSVKGKLISETEELIVLQDDSGVRINFKKSNVDLEKTTASNKVEEPAQTTPPPEAAHPEEKIEKPAASAPKKPGRVFTERDLQRLRSKYPMEGGPSGVAEGLPAVAEEERTEDYWRGAWQELSGAVKQTEQELQQLTRNCQMLKGATIQTHRVLNEKGETQNMAETTENYCQQAERAQTTHNQAKQDFENFLQEAREENVPPGWVGLQ